MNGSEAERPTRYALEITTHSERVRVTIEDGWGTVVRDRHVGVPTTYVESLPQGLYTVRFTLGPFLTECTVRVAKGKSEPVPVSQPPGMIRSPVPVKGSSSYDKFAEPVKEWSDKLTRSPRHAPNSDSQLFVFIARHESATDVMGLEEAFGEQLISGLSLSNQAGERIALFHVHVDSLGQWLVLSFDAHAGIYYLRDDSQKPARMTVLWLYSGWQTQVFIRHRGRPVTEEIQLLMAPLGQGFDPEDPVAVASVLAQISLAYGPNIIPREAVRQVVSGSSENPLLTLATGYYLLTHDVSAEDGTGKAAHEPAEWTRQVVQRLDEIIPNSMDAAAFRHFAFRQADWPPPQDSRFELPPAFRLGLEAVIDDSARIPEILPRTSVLTSVSEDLFIDSNWTSWQAEEIVRQGDAQSFSLKRQVRFDRPRAAKQPDWIVSSVADAVRRQAAHGRLDPNQIAQQLRISQPSLLTVAKTLRELDSSSREFESFAELTQLACETQDETLAIPQVALLGRWDTEKAEGLYDALAEQMAAIGLIAESELWFKQFTPENALEVDWEWMPVAVWNGSGPADVESAQLLSQFEAHQCAVAPLKWNAKSMAKELQTSLDLNPLFRHVLLAYDGENDCDQENVRDAVEVMTSILGERGFEVSCDDHAGTQESILLETLDKLPWTTAVLLFDTSGRAGPEFDQWMFDQLNRAAAMGIGIVQVVWPAVRVRRGMDFCEPVVLAEGDLTRRGPDAPEKLVEIVDKLNSVWYQSIRMRRKRIIDVTSQAARQMQLTAAVEADGRLAIVREGECVARISPWCDGPQFAASEVSSVSPDDDDVPTAVVYDPLGRAPAIVPKLLRMEGLPRLLDLRQVATWLAETL